MASMLANQIFHMQLMGEKAAKVENFGTYLSDLPVNVTDKSLLQLSAQVMGHLVRSNVQLTAALVDNEVHFSFFTLDSSILLCQMGMKRRLIHAKT